jgi:hypothetical protein
MSQFQACRGCGATIHVTATACPQCGAPSGVAPGAGASHGGVNVAAPVPATPVIPWFRKRWFAVLCVITITPIASLLALTGDVFYKNAAGSLVTLPKNYKTAMMLGTLPWLFLMFGSPSQMLMPTIALLFAGAMIAFKK